MTKEEVINKITAEDDYGIRCIKEEFLSEIEEAAFEEGCEWGEQTPQIVELYRNLQPDYVSEEFVKALYEEVINLYVHMVNNTQIVELPERQEVVKRPASKKREWVY